MWQVRGWGLLEGHKNRKMDEDPILSLLPASLQMKILSPEVCSSITSHSRLASGLGLEFKLLFLRRRQLTFAVWIPYDVTPAENSSVQLSVGLRPE